MRPYTEASDLQRILGLKRACTTPENMYDAPTLSELRALLAPFPQDPAAERPPWEDEQGRVIGHLYRRARTQRATMLWVEADGILVAYALIAPPSTVLTFQVHPQARDSGLEAQMLAWAIARAQEQARQCGRTFSLWCSCHESEPERHALLEEAGFKPLPARDLRLVRSLDIPLLETEQAETPALHLFTSLGFRRVSAWQWMTKEIATLTWIAQDQQSRCATDLSVALRRPGELSATWT